MPNSTRAERSKAFVEAYRKNENVEVIPSRQDIKGDEEEEKEELVGAYCRVSTMNEAQVESYELQKAYYEDMVERRPNWRLVDIYPDEGISATSMRNRRLQAGEAHAYRDQIRITICAERRGRNLSGTDAAKPQSACSGLF